MFHVCLFSLENFYQKCTYYFFRVWKGAGDCTHVLDGHSDAVTSISIVNPKGILARLQYYLLPVANIVYINFSACYVSMLEDN